MICSSYVAALLLLTLGWATELCRKIIFDEDLVVSSEPLS